MWLRYYSLNMAWLQWDCWEKKNCKVHCWGPLTRGGPSVSLLPYGAVNMGVCGVCT